MKTHRLISKILMHFGFISQVTANITYNRPNQTLAGKKIIITGGSRGLGFAMRRSLKPKEQKSLLLAVVKRLSRQAPRR